MAKVFGPCLSISASGSVKKTITFQRRPSGVSAIRPPVPPRGKTSNPSAAQAAHRTIISNLVSAWQAFTVAQKAEWQAESDYVGDHLSGYHTFMKSATGLPLAVIDVLGPYTAADPRRRAFLLDSGKLA